MTLTHRLTTSHLTADSESGQWSFPFEIGLSTLIRKLTHWENSLCPRSLIESIYCICNSQWRSSPRRLGHYTSPPWALGIFIHSSLLFSPLILTASKRTKIGIPLMRFGGEKYRCEDVDSPHREIWLALSRGYANQDSPRKTCCSLQQPTYCCASNSCRHWALGLETSVKRLSWSAYTGPAPVCSSSSTIPGL